MIDGQDANLSPAVGSIDDTEQISLKLLALFIPENWEDPLGSTIAIVASYGGVKMC